MSPSSARTSPACSVLLLATCLAIPSVAKIWPTFGLTGATAYFAVLAAVLLAATRLDWAYRAAAIPPRLASALLAITLLLLALAFVLIYPRVTSGSDRDEALDLATRELLAGRFPYYPRVLPTGVHVGPGNPISPLPGELILAIPFVLLGSGARQVFFWLGAYFYVAAALLRSHGVALLATWATVFLAPAAMHEIVTGGDLFANAMWVLVLGALVVSSRGTWKGALSAILFGVGLSSRVHFLLVVPLVFVVLTMRHGRATALGRCGLALGAFAAVTLPFYLHDPGRFSPLHVFGKLGTLTGGGLPVLVAASAVASLLGAAWMARSKGGDAHALVAAALVLAVPVAVTVILATSHGDTRGFAEFGWYALSSLPFGVLGAFGLGRDAPSTQTPG